MNRAYFANLGSKQYPIACTATGRHYQLPPLTWVSAFQRAIEAGESYPFHVQLDDGAITAVELVRHNELHKRQLRPKLQAGLFIDYGLLYIVQKGKYRKNVYGEVVSPRPVEHDVITDFMGEPIAPAYINEHYVSFSYLDWMYCGPLPFLHGDKSITTKFTAYAMR